MRRPKINTEYLGLLAALLVGTLSVNSMPLLVGGVIAGLQLNPANAGLLASMELGAVAATTLYLSRNLCAFDFRALGWWGASLAFMGNSSCWLTLSEFIPQTSFASLNGQQLDGKVGVPSDRKRGCARFLMNHLTAHFTEEGSERLTLDTASTNSRARSLYESLGYEREKVSCRHVELEEPFHLQTEAVVLGAGYQYNFPSCLEGLRHLLDFHSDGRVTVQRDYSLKTRLQGPGRIFIQNGEMHTHGVAAPDLGLGSHRNATIINALLGEQRYVTSSKTVFQTFGIAGCWQPVASS